MNLQFLYFCTLNWGVFLKVPFLPFILLTNTDNMKNNYYHIFIGGKYERLDNSQNSLLCV